MASIKAITTLSACAIPLALCTFLAIISATHGEEMPSIPQPTRAQSQPQAAIIYKAPDESSGTASGLGANRSKYVPFIPEVRVEGDGRKTDNRVGVHIPMIFDMNNQVGAGKNQSKLDLSVLSGLVTVNKDKQRNPSTGEVSGPVTVTVFGIPVYSGKTAQQTRLRSRGEDLKDSVQSRQAAISDGVRSTSDSIQDTVSSTNEKVIGTLSSLVDRIASIIHRPKDHD